MFRKLKSQIHPLAKARIRAEAAERLRQLQRTDLPAWAIEAVALVLRASVDHIRRIPFHELPYSRPGKRNLYLPDDVVQYLMLLRKKSSGHVDNCFASRNKTINSLVDSVRGRSHNGERHV